MHLDTDHLNTLRAVIGDQVADLLRIYQDSTPDYLQQLAQALQEMDFAAMQHAAHTLKGSAANIGAADMAELCQKLELSASNQQSCAMVQLIEAVNQEAQRVEQAINAFLA